MRIVILRHAEVDFEWSRLCSSKKFDSECSSYDSSPIKEIVLSKPQIRYEKNTSANYQEAGIRLKWYFLMKTI